MRSIPSISSRLDTSGSGVKTTPSEISASLDPLQDRATCTDCLRELFDPSDRRHRYLFTTCDRCGPAYALAKSLPFRRRDSTLAPFDLCGECRAEQQDPTGRRRRCQTIACRRCGPTHWIEPAPAHSSADIVQAAAACLEERHIVAIKSFTGFYLLCLAEDTAVVDQMRRRLQQPRHAFPLLVADAAAARKLSDLPPHAIALLQDSGAPAVQAPQRRSGAVSSSVAPFSIDYTLRLPSTPLEHLLTMTVGKPLVAVSARSQGQAVLDNETARSELAETADYLVMHDLELQRTCTDTVIRTQDGSSQLVRRARGLTHGSIRLSRALPMTLGVGGAPGSSIALARGNRVVLSEPLPEGGVPIEPESLADRVRDFLKLWNANPHRIAYDARSGKAGQHVAENLGAVGVEVQHHHAHIASVLAEHHLEGPVVGLALDSSGGDLFVADACRCNRVDGVPSYRLPGVGQHPWQVAAGVLWDLIDAETARRWIRSVAASTDAADFIISSLQTDVGCERTTSLGQIYRAAAAILGLSPPRQDPSEATSALERAAGLPRLVHDLPHAGAMGRGYFREVLLRLIGMSRRQDTATAAAWLQAALAQWASLSAIRACRRYGISIVAASGACTVQRWLRSTLESRLPAAGVQLFTNKQVPASDGGVALGQVWVAAHRSGALRT